MQKLIEKLELIVGRGNLLTDHASKLAYSRAACTGAPPADILPLAIARPAHKTQLRKLLEYCAQQKIPLVFRGNGTRFAGQSTPLLADSLVILSTGLTRIYEADRRNFTIRAQAGATAAAVQSACAKTGLYCPILGAANSPSTIGGLLAVNEAGPGFYCAGSPADYLAAIEVFTTDGKTFKGNAAHGLAYGCGGAFPVPQLFCGTKGALVFISECELRLELLPSSFSRIARQFPDMKAALAGADICMQQQGLLPSCLEIFDPVCAGNVGPAFAEKWVLCAEYHNAADEFLQNLDRNLSEKTGAVKLPDSAPFFNMASNLPTLLVRDFWPLDYCPCSCRPAQFNRFCEAIMTLGQEAGQKIILWGYPGAGTVYLAIPQNPGTGEFKKRLSELELMFNDCLESDGQSNKKLQSGLGVRAADALAQIFDPGGLLEPQRKRWCGR